MKRRAILLAVALISASGARVSAATVKLSGHYLLTESKTCQPSLTDNTALALTSAVLNNGLIISTAPFLTGLNADAGSFQSVVGLITFGRGSFSASTIEGKGSLLNYDGIGDPISEDSPTLSGSYSISSSSLTFGDTTYTGFVGRISATDVASLVRVINVTPPCVDVLYLDHQ
jgi:hypothetical protein